MPAPLKSVLRWLAYAGLVILAGGAMLLGKADALLVEGLRLRINDAVVPILGVLSKPVDTLAGGIETAQHWVGVAEENARLRDERDRLLRWQTAAQRLEAENAALRRLLNFVPGPEATFRTGRVVADPTGAFAHSVLVDAGSRDGVDKGHIVLTGDGLVGRVIGVSQRAARVLLITDLNSRVPVFVGEARARAMLAGDNSERPKLTHLLQEDKIAVGDLVVSSGVAGGFPSSLPVGVVAEVDDGRIIVRPYVDRTRLEYVRIADYGMTPPLIEPPSASRGGRPAVSNERPDGERADAR